MGESVDRVFYALPKDTEGTHEIQKDEDLSDGSSATKSKASKDHSILSYISDSVIGANKIFTGPYGLRKVVYLDYVASGKSLTFIEDYIRREVLPEYGNTHTTTSITSLQTTLFRHEARDIVRNACNASEHDSVIFAGSGTTRAVHKLIHSLNIKLQATVVFVGPYEHHSNLLPWQAAGATVIKVSATAQGHLDLEDLECKLKAYSIQGRQLIGAFSAASNVTGILTDVDTVTVCLHRYGALAFWDYASAAPYVKIDMNPYTGREGQNLVYKDAIYFSMHKFVGGTQTPGVLIAKKALFKNPIPDGCGGSTVFFVRRENVCYLQEPELKEEGGTPAIVESIRAGLVMQLKESVGADVIMKRDHVLRQKALQAWSQCPGLVLLGPTEPQSSGLPIFSFLVHHPDTGRFLHHNFVAAVLNDVFGIQARGGCACAGPYAMDLLGLEESKAKQIEELIAEDSRLDRTHLRRTREYSHREILRPGFVRINLPYFLEEDCVDFVIEAVALTAQHGWKLMPQYLFNPETGEWRQKTFQTFKDRKWLGHISYQKGSMCYQQPTQHIKGPLPTSYQDCLTKARDIFALATKHPQKLPDQSVMFVECARLFRWFCLPSEANACLSRDHQAKPVPATQLPFCPRKLLRRLGHVSEISETLPNQQLDLGSVGGAVKTDQKEALPISDSLMKQRFDQEATGGSVISDQERERELISQELKLNVEEGEDETQPLPRLKEKNMFSEGMIQAFSNGFQDNTVSDYEDTKSSFVNGVDTSESLLKNVERLTIDESAQDAWEFTHHKKYSADISEFHHYVNDSSEFYNEEENNSETDQGSSQNEAKIKDASFTSNRALSCDSDVSSLFNKSNQVHHTAENNKLLNGALSCDIKASPSLNCDNEVNENATPSNKSAPKTEGAVSFVCPLVRKKPNIGNVAWANNPSGCQESTPSPSVRWFSPPKQIFKPAVTALEEYEMLKTGDRVLVCLSGGKDSLSLLHTVRQYQFYARGKGIHFEFGAVTVDPQTPAYDPSPLKQYLAALGVPYFYESQGILETAENLPYECASICSFCSRMKRGRIYAAARREGYNILALGQHLDDLAESFMMSFFHNGSLNTMKAHYTVKQGDLRVIRPFVYVRESDLREFAEKKKLPVISENCPACFEAPKERHRSKQLLASQEVMFPNVYSSMMAALKPLMARGIESSSSAPLQDSDGDDS